MRKIISALLVLLTVMSTLLCLAVPVSADSTYVKKVVSVVYDDSGSMGNKNGEQWANANYAMQTFCGMLNSEDKLFVTYMNGPTETYDLSTEAAVQKSVDHIRGYWRPVGAGTGTPFSAVRDAYAKLKEESENDTDPTTQYWLVVITDGEFTSDDGKPSFYDGKDKKTEQLSAPFQEWLNPENDLNRMGNGTLPRMTFLAIGSGVTTPTNEALGGNEEDQRVFVAKDSSETVATMAELADKISGRKSTKVTVKDDKTVQVTSNHPLFNIVVLNQNSNVKVKEVKRENAEDKDNGAISVDRKIGLSYDYNGGNLKGTICSIRNSGGTSTSSAMLKGGTYTVTFEDKVNPNDIVILFEPALEIRMTLVYNGKEITDSQEIYEVLNRAKPDETVSATFEVYDLETGQPIKLENAVFDIGVYENGKKQDGLAAKDNKLEGYQLKDLLTKITANVKDGELNLNSVWEFTPGSAAPLNYTVSAAFKDDKVQEVKLDEIGKNDQLALVFTVLADGAPVTDPAAVKALNPTVSLDLAGNSGEMKVESDGRIVYTPNAAAAPADKQDEFKVTATCKLQGGESASLGYTVKVAEYELKAEYLDKTVQNVSFDSIQSNKALALVFTVLKNGTPLTDPAAVKALNPVITVDLAGNSGETKVESDGRIVYTPNAAAAPAGKSDEFTVNVKCTLENTAAKKEASLPYKVLMAKFEVFAVNGTGPVKKTELFGNKQSVSFYVKKDDRRLTGDELKPYEGAGYFTLDGAQSKLKLSVSASGGTGDGILTVTPYSEEEYQLNFFSWWSNWYHYWFELSGEDVKVSFNPFGTATAVLDVTEEGFVYQAFCVYLPLLLELAILYVIVSYTYCVLAKPKFGKSAVIYSGRVFFDPYTNTHEITGMSRTSLVRFNKLKYRLAYTTKSKTVTAGGIRVSAGKGGRVECYERGPSFKGNISFVHNSTLQLPSEILKYCREFGVNFSIAPFSPIATIDKSSVGTLTPTNKTFPTYYIAGAKLADDGGPFVIENGKIFLYLNES